MHEPELTHVVALVWQHTLDASCFEVVSDQRTFEGSPALRELACAAIGPIVRCYRSIVVGKRCGLVRTVFSEIWHGRSTIEHCSVSVFAHDERYSLGSMILFAGIVQSKFKPCNLSKLGVPTSPRSQETDQAPAHAIAYVVPWDLN